MKKISQVLMCRPIYFQIKYVINPWMESQKVDETKALEQWEKLYQTYKDLEIDVQLIEQQEVAPDMVFTTDIGLTKNKKILMSNFATRERQEEERIFETWFTDNGYQIERLPDDCQFEGGDFQKWNGSMFGGHGFRTTENSMERVGRGLDFEVIPLKLIDSRFYHLDTCLLPISDSLVFYYQDAFAPESVAELKKRVSNLVPFSQRQAFGFMSNSVVTDGHVVCQNPDIEFTQILQENGYDVIEIDMSEFNKSGGGIHCLTQILQENAVV